MSKVLLSPDYIVLSGKIADIKSDKDILVCDFDNEKSLCARHKIDINLLVGEDKVNVKKNVEKETKNVKSESGSGVLDIFGDVEEGEKEMVNEINKTIEEVVEEVKANGGIFYYEKDFGYSASDKSDSIIKDESMQIAYPNLLFSSDGIGVMLSFHGTGKLSVDEVLGGNTGVRETIPVFKSRYIKRDGKLKMTSLGVAFKKKVNLEYLTEIEQDEAKKEYIKQNAKGFDNVVLYRWNIPEGIKEVNCDELLTDKDFVDYEKYAVQNSLKKCAKKILDDRGIKTVGVDIFEKYSEEDKKKLREAIAPHSSSSENEKVELSGKGWGKMPSGNDMLNGEIKGQKKLNDIQEKIINDKSASKLRELNMNLMAGVNDKDKQAVDKILESSESASDEAMKSLRRKVLNGCYQGGYKKIIVGSEFAKEKDGVYTAGNGFQIKTGLEVETK